MTFFALRAYPPVQVPSSPQARWPTESSAALCSAAALEDAQPMDVAHLAELANEVLAGGAIERRATAHDNDVRRIEQYRGRADPLGRRVALQFGWHHFANRER